MGYFKKEELIRCYRERKSDRCTECKLAQPAKKLPYGIEDNVTALVENVLEQARRKLGKPIIVNSGFRCPLHNGRVGGATASQHMKGEAADLRIDGKPEELARVIVANGKYDQLILYPTFVHVSWKKAGGNRKETLRKVGNGYQRIDASKI